MVLASRVAPENRLDTGCRDFVVRTSSKVIHDGISSS